MTNGSGSRPCGRSLDDFRIEGSATEHGVLPAEEILLRNARIGEETVILKERPATPSDGKGNVVRAGFIRFLALGGDDTAPVHERGVWLTGAYITGGDLDLQGCKGVLPIFLRCCWFEGSIIIRDAHTRTVNLDASRVLGLDGKRAHVDGSIYLRHEGYHETLDTPVRFPFTSDRGVNLIDSKTTGSLECHHAQFGLQHGAAVHASRARIGGSVFLRSSFAAKGPIFFRGAKIGGNFECSGGSFDAADERHGIAISCQGAKIRGSVYFRQTEKDQLCFTAKGEVRFIDAEIGGSFECHGANIENPSGNALYCSRIKVAGSVFIHQGFTAKGEVGFRGAEIGGNFQCDGGTFERGQNKDSAAISCNSAKIGGSVFLRIYKEDSGGDTSPFRAEGQVSFIDAEINGSFECHGAIMRNNRAEDRLFSSEKSSAEERIDNNEDIALHCSRIKVSGSVLLYEEFDCQGEISFRRADIGGNFDASESKLANAVGKALSCESAHITGSVLLNRKFEATGEVNFAGAEIEGDFDCDNGVFSAPGGLALDCSRARISGGVSVGSGFHSEGEVTFAEAEVGGRLNCAGGSFINSRPHAANAESCANALTLRSAAISGELCFARAETSASVHGSLDLRNAKASVFTDVEKSWPKAWDEVVSGAVDAKLGKAKHSKLSALRCFIYLNGFTYTRFGEGAPLTPAMRRKWLKLQPASDLGLGSQSFTMQPFEQLVTVLRETGNRRYARSIAMFKLACRLRRDRDGKSWLANPINWVKWIVAEKAVGYGYGWRRVLVASVVAWVVFSVFFGLAIRQGAICKVVDDKVINGKLCVVEAADRSEFSPMLYSLEGLLVAPQAISAYVIFPQIKVQQKTIYLTHFENYQPKTAPMKMPLLEIDLPDNTTVVVRTVVMAFSWLASALLLAVATGLIRRE
jgi:hypothetical protein